MPSETSEPSVTVAASQGLSPAHVPTGDEAHQGTGAHRLQGAPPSGLVSLLPQLLVRGPHSPILIPLPESEEYSSVRMDHSIFMFLLLDILVDPMS